MSNLLQDNSFIRRTYNAFCDIYSRGPSDQCIWERAGGDESRIVLYGLGRFQWWIALRQLKNGIGGATLQSLLSEALGDFPRNPEFLALHKSLDNEQNAETLSETPSSTLLVNKSVSLKDALAFFDRSAAIEVIDNKLSSDFDYIIVKGQDRDDPESFSKAVGNILEYKKITNQGYVTVLFDVYQSCYIQGGFYRYLKKIYGEMYQRLTVLKYSGFKPFVEKRKKTDKENLESLEELCITCLSCLLRSHRGAQIVHLFFNHHFSGNDSSINSADFYSFIEEKWRYLIKKALLQGDRNHVFSGEVQIFLLFEMTTDVENKTTVSGFTNQINLSALTCNELIIRGWTQTLANYLPYEHTASVWGEALEKSIKRQFRFSRRLSFKTLWNKIQKDKKFK